MAIHADALWSAGMFDEAESEFRDALSLAPDMSRGRHGLAKALASRSKLDEALNEVQAALRTSPRDGEIHHTTGAIFERLRRYEEAAGAYANYVNLLPNKDKQRQGDVVEGADPVPAGVQEPARQRPRRELARPAPHRALQAGAGQGHRQGPRSTAGAGWTSCSTPAPSRRPSRARSVRRNGVVPITYTLSAGVGEVGLRGLQLARLDTLRGRHAESAGRAGPDQEPGAQGHSQARDGELLADGAGPVDDHRLRHQAAHHRRAAHRRAGRHHAAAAHAPAGHGARR